MKNTCCRLPWRRRDSVCRFGRAVLVRRSGGGYELRGGSPAERAAAYEWISLFQQDVVPRSPADN
jgi:hypothetical protein